MPNDLITLRDVCYTYDADGESPNEVLKGLNISFPVGQFCAVLGRNGCGKSTLARLLNGLLKPTSGEVTVGGLPVNEENELAVRRKVGLVFQNPDNQLVATSVEDDVAFGMENIGVPREEMARRVEASLRAVDMWEYRESSPANLSGGQKQRVAIAGILAMEPECVVFDEPTAMLDPKGRREVMDTVLSLKAAKNITVIFITHFMEEAALSDRVVILDEGGVAADGKPGEIFLQTERLRALGLDVPVGAALINELNAAGAGLPVGAVTAGECAAVLAEALMKRSHGGAVCRS